MTAAEEERWIAGLGKTWADRRRAVLELLQYADEDDMSAEDRGICMRWLTRLDSGLGYPDGTWRQIVQRRCARRPVVRPPAPVRSTTPETGVASGTSVPCKPSVGTYISALCAGCGQPFPALIRTSTTRQRYHSRACWKAHNPVKGAGHPNAKRTPAVIAAFRALATTTGNCAGAGRQFGIGRALAYQIAVGARWASTLTHD